MATATASSAFDLGAQATFPIRLGASITKPATPSRFSSVRYNWKPEIKHADTASASISEDDGAAKSWLVLRDDAGEYTYAGKHVQNEESFALVFRGQGKDREAVLERVSSSHAFNLIGTPSENDAAKLAELHSLLPADEGEDDLFGDTEEDGPPDESNPFDFRHFLKAELEQPEMANTADTPLAKPVPRSTAASRPVKRAEPKAAPATKRKAPTVSKAKTKRVKAGEEPAEPPKAKARPEIPKINMDRKASLRRSSVGDSGDLVLEESTPVMEKPRAMAMALNGQLETGPINPQSAASSPESHIATPEPEKADAGEGEYVFEFDDDPEPEGQDEEDEDADADVDKFELPSPAQAHRSSVAAPAVDEEDDLDAQLAAAMMEAEDGGQEENESEESEEE